MRRIIPLVVLLIILVLSAVFVSPLAGSLLLLLYLLVQLYRKRGVYYSKRGYRAFSEGDISHAVAWYEKSYKRKNPSVKTTLSLALLYEKSGRFADARLLVERLKEEGALNDYEKGGLETTEAVLLWKEGYPEKADSKFREISATFRNTSLYGCMGAFYLARDDRDRAFSLAEEAYRFNGDNNIIRDNYACALSLQGRKGEARGIWEKLVGENCSIAEPYYHLARQIVLEEGDREEAKRILAKGLAFPLSRISYLKEEDFAGLLRDLDPEKQFS